MDKQEAIDFVLDELDKGRSPAEITAALSRRLGAPIDLVSKFVRQTTVRYQESKAAVSQGPAAVSKQPSADSRQPSAFSAQPQAASQKPATISQPPAAYSQPPIAASQEPLAVSQPPAAYSPQTVAYSAQTTARAEEPIPLPDVGYATQEELAPAPVGRETTVSPELEKFILDELGKHTRQGDVVLGVVEQTGMEYQQAQLLVARVGSRNYKKVTARQNCLIIPLAVIALVAGLVLLGASVFEAYEIRVLLPSPNNLSMEQVRAAVERGRDLPWAFITGLALAVGGGIGLIGAIRKQME
jgi:hypothetical protein